MTGRKLLDLNNFEALESDLTLFGVCGIKDPARVEVRGSILKCREAGIRVFMITGDNKATAEAIACDVGIFEPNEDVSRTSVRGRSSCSSSLQHASSWR